MAGELLTIKLYYDYKSPFAYLAMAPAYALMESHRVRLHYIPHELNIRGAFGGDLDERPEREWRKIRYLYLDARRYANARGVIITLRDRPEPSSSFQSSRSALISCSIASISSSPASRVP